MKIYNSIINRLFLRPILVNSVPKSGTNLLHKATCSLPGARSTGIHIGASSARLENPPEGLIEVGVDMPRRVSAAWFRRKLSQASNGNVLTSHIPYSQMADDIISELGLSHVAIVRHPADVALSHAKFCHQNTDHFLYDLYSRLDFSDRLKTSIVGNSEIGLKGLKDRFSGIVEWALHSNLLLVRFEDLVGDKGGGDRQSQAKSLESIVKFTGASMSINEINACVSNLFGGTHTFRIGRGGQAGGWRDDLGDDHLHMLKDEVGGMADLLGYNLDKR